LALPTSNVFVKTYSLDLIPLSNGKLASNSSPKVLFIQGGNFFFSTNWVAINPSPP